MQVYIYTLLRSVQRLVCDIFDAGHFEINYLNLKGRNAQNHITKQMRSSRKTLRDSVWADDDAHLRIATLLDTSREHSKINTNKHELHHHGDVYINV